MSKANYEPSYQRILGVEAGFWNDPKGGPTMNGVTQSTYDSWRRNHGLPTQDVRKLSTTERELIYRDGYWVPIKGDQLPTGLDYATFDYAINSGPVQAIKDLQRVLNVAADGSIGPRTIEAANVAMSNGGYKVTLEAYIAKRWAFMQTLRNFPENKNGWYKRKESVLSAAIAMAASGPFDEAPASATEALVGASDDIPDTYPALSCSRALPRDVRPLATNEGKGLLLSFTGLCVAIIPRIRFTNDDASLNDAIYLAYHSYAVFALVLGLCIMAWQFLKKRNEKYS